MSEFKVKDIITPIMEFVKSCPFLDEYNIDLTDLSIQKLFEGGPNSSAIDYKGSNQISSLKDINNRKGSIRQANFDIWLIRRSDQDFYRKEIADFIWNFEQWVEHCQANEITPKISDNESDQYEEVMFADNGVFYADWEDQETSLYKIQLHIKYFNRY